MGCGTRKGRSQPPRLTETLTTLRTEHQLQKRDLVRRFGDFFSHWTFPRAILILPRQTVVFPGRADDMLCVLVHLRIIVLLLGILVLCLDKTTTNLNGIQFVRADPPI